MHSSEERIYFTILITASIIGLILLFFLVTIIRQHKKRVKLYNEQLRQEVELLETERARIAADLHDDIGPLLSAVKMNLHLLDTTDKNDLVIIGKTTGHIDYTAKRLREISNNIMPYTLQSKGLTKAVEEMIDLLSVTTALQFSFDHQFAEIPVSKEKEIHIYRLLQEVLNNVVKHANATKVDISMYKEKKQYCINVRDNGAGFDQQEAIGRTKGLGLQNILRRTEILKGKVYLETAPGKGTSYHFSIPQT
jgi:signal transduction histidine kinase